MAGKGSKWLMGCGIGCGLVVMVFVVVSVMIGLFFRETFRPIQEAVESHDALIEAQGDVEEFVPERDGTVPAARMEVFLSVREGMGDARRHLDTFLAEFPPADLRDQEGVVNILMQVLGSLDDWLEPMAAYVERRNQLLLESGMGPGEYLYIYGLAYYSWLGNGPEEGPVVTREGGGQMFGSDDGTFSPQMVRRRYRRYFVAFLRNQLDAVPETDPALEAWRTELAAELARFESRPGSIAWRDGLPPAVGASLEPYRERLEASYSRNGNCFEWPLQEGEGWN
jgi:hypothetical protein